MAEMRAALEVLALRHAVHHLTPAILDARRGGHPRRPMPPRDVRSWEEANRALPSPDPRALQHEPRLLASIDDLHAASARFLFSAWRSSWEKRTDHDHRAILAALRGRAAATRPPPSSRRHVQWIGRGAAVRATRPARRARSFAIVG